MDESEKTPLTTEYFEVMERPADVVYDFRKEQPTLGEGEQGSSTHPPIRCFDLPLFQHALSGVGTNGDGTTSAPLPHVAQQAGVEDAFVVLNLLSTEECKEIITGAEKDGIVPPKEEAGTLRTAKRTDNYQDPQLSAKIADRLQSVLMEKLSEKPATNDENNSSSGDNKYFGEFHSIHTNWRVLRYDPPSWSSSSSSSPTAMGDAFPAHQDQMDSIQLLNKTTGKKDFVVSTHTLLINLTPPTITSTTGGDKKKREGGATRFYPRAKVAGKSPGQYNQSSVDVWLPQGAAMAFPQFGMVHAGQPVLAGESPKFIAQAGILRKLPPGRTLRPNVFRLGPGLQIS